MKILVIQLGTMADVLLATPVVRCLKTQLQQAELHLLINHQHAIVVSGNPYIDHLHELHFNQQTTLRQLLPQQFDYVLDLQPNTVSTTLVNGLNAPVPKTKQKGWKAFFAQVFNSTKSGHAAEKYLQLAAPLSIANDGKGLDFLIPKNEEVPFNDIPASHHAGYIAIAISDAEGLSLPTEMLRHLCSRIQYPIVLIGFENDRAKGDAIKAVDAIKVYNACGKFSVHETADLLRKARLQIAFQPYFIQLAAALKKVQVITFVRSVKGQEPYYGSLFLKSINKPAYDKVDVPDGIIENYTNTNESVKAKTETFILSMVQKVNERLRPKA